MPKEITEELNKSIDAKIDELFLEETSEEVVKSMIKDDKPQEETADEAASKAPKAQKDESRGAGRPKQISDVPQTDTDGRRQDDYDGSIAGKNEDGKTKEQDQVEPPKELKKATPEGEEKLSKSVSEEEWKEYQELKKAKKEKEDEEALVKAEKRQSDLIKSAVLEATQDLREKNEFLEKSLSESQELIKAIANKPQRPKAVTGYGAVERFQKSANETEALTKAEILDVAEDLVKSEKLTMEHAIEFEQTGDIFDKNAKGVLEREIKRRYSL